MLRKRQQNDIGLDERRYIGSAVARPNARRLLQGRGTYVDDIALPRMAHVVYWRSPVAHARITAFDSSFARMMPGIIGIYQASDLEGVCKPWVATLSHLAGMKSAVQYPLAPGHLCWQGEPVYAVVAESRREAEDAMPYLQVEWEELPVVADMEHALDADAPVIHPELGDNLCFTRTIDTGNVSAAFASADLVVEETYHFGRHTGVTMETRSVLADFNAADNTLTVYHSHQAPHMMQDLYSRHLDLPEGSVRVICKDVGGSFGIKVHSYPDDFATVALAKSLRRPVKFVADRLESFASDIHAREHRVHARLAAMADGRIVGFEIDDLSGVGPYSVYPRTSGIEGNQVLNITGGPYQHEHYRAVLRVVFQNKSPMSQYRGVGHPIACAVTEGIVDLAAQRLGIDPLALRRMNVMRDDSYPRTAASGIKLEGLSHEACLDEIEEMIDYGRLREEQHTLRSQGVYRGIGIASMVELTNPGAAFYGVGGARIAAQDGATVRLDAGGGISVLVSVGEQGQGTETIFAQIAADTLSMPIGSVRVVTGDTGVTPYGGGTWASRGAGIGGEAVLQASIALCAQVIDFAARLHQRERSGLTLADGAVVDTATGETVARLVDLATQAYFRPDTLPPGIHPELSATRHYAQRDYPFVFTNGVHVSHVEVDVETGMVKLLKHWVVEDCGRVLNPMLADEQIRGAVVQGIGGVLFEECLYDAGGSLRNGNMADYLVPMAAEMPDIEVAHIETPTATSQLGAKGAGEAGTAGAPAAVMNAINDALAPFNARLTSHPITPEKILIALGTVSASR
ncbi:xanthine dehydrogenase family protein molybdopterin-binding subunit [Paraburkholderia phenazinium]|uniref:Xanthine dehydrogenase, molybdenum binding subunit apoprotein n=1 Tax=Paraburkholderia phenazinium TaxID=60549 RepID=A0A1N6HG50_9BURK|nr:xanthine dehydrogenase family protein molybdopterin-binding subunit [Paraburkholderia phenazinium]SIO18834.1 xanthine dehydrogenase, molybdenum binding subunit apoprotein [Paraburkholderia phenazinium]